MPKLVVMGAMCKCSMGTGPCTMIVAPANMVNGCNVPAATVMDFSPANMPSFIMCMGTNSANPAVAALTAAAMGTPTPAPCVPVVTGPWSPGAAKTKIGQFAALNDSSTCQCAWTGTISVVSAGQGTIDID